MNTVARIADSLLQITPTFEDLFKLRDVLASDVATKPDIFQFAQTQSLSSDLGRCAILIAILRTCCNPAVLDHNLILRNELISPSVEVQADIHDLEHSRNDLLPIPTSPNLFKGEILVCDNFRGLLQNIDELSIWNAATGETLMRISILINLFKSRLERNMEPEWDNNNIIFDLGHNFYDTAKGCCRGNPVSFQRRLLRAIVETIEDLRMDATHALRIGKGGDDPQRKRGEDKAWRRDIDYEYHLHYWECENGRIEFASIATHNNFTIPE